MPLVGSRSDGLRLELSGAEIPFMRIVGGLPGIVVLSAAARNGIGAGRLQSTANRLAWQAPGSAVFGDLVRADADGIYMLEDGEDQSKWIRIQTYTNYLPDHGEAHVYLEDSFNALCADIAAADAAAGVTDTVQFSLVNANLKVLQNVKLWIDAASPATLFVSSDGTNFYQPVSAIDAHVLTWSSIGIGASVSVWVRRVIGAGAESNPSILNILQWSWDALN